MSFTRAQPLRSAADRLIIDSLPPQSVLLDKGWRWHAGDNPNWANPTVDDRSWQSIDPTKDIMELPAVRHAGIGWFRLHLVINPLVLPILLGNIAPLALFFNRPPSVPKWTLWVALACALTAWASTILFQVPIEQQFDQGHYTPALMERLWQTDWIHKVAFFVEIGVVIYMATSFFRSVTVRLTPPNADVVTTV